MMNVSFVDEKKNELTKEQALYAINNNQKIFTIRERASTNWHIAIYENNFIYWNGHIINDNSLDTMIKLVSEDNPLKPPPICTVCTKGATRHNPLRVVGRNRLHHDKCYVYSRTSMENINVAPAEITYNQIRTLISKGENITIWAGVGKLIVTPEMLQKQKLGDIVKNFVNRK